MNEDQSAAVEGAHKAIEARQTWTLHRNNCRRCQQSPVKCADGITTSTLDQMRGDYARAALTQYAAPGTDVLHRDTVVAHLDGWWIVAELCECGECHGTGYVLAREDGSTTSCIAPLYIVPVDERGPGRPDLYDGAWLAVRHVAGILGRYALTLEMDVKHGTEERVRVIYPSGDHHRLGVVAQARRDEGGSYIAAALEQLANVRANANRGAAYSAAIARSVQTLGRLRAQVEGTAQPRRSRIG